MTKFAKCYLWVDLETTGLPVGNDYSDVYILEAAAILTDFNLVKNSGSYDLIKPTPAAVQALKNNPVVIKMHQESGLLEELRTATLTLEEVEESILDMIRSSTDFEPGEIQIAGSGVASFDFPLIKEKMPRLASWLAYYPMDVGVLRRGLKNLSGGRNMYNPVASSYQEGVKKHRAWTDALSHLEEAEWIKNWLATL